MKRITTVAATLVLVAVAAGVTYRHEMRRSPAPEVKAPSVDQPRRASDVTLLKARLHGSVVKPSVGTLDWHSEFLKAQDYFTFVGTAALAAQNGDPRASYYVGRALTECALVKNKYQDSPDPEGALRDEIAGLPKMPQWVQDQRFKQLHLCIRLAKEDPFDKLPKREGGYWDSKYWYNQALAGHDPLAQIDAAATTLSSLSANASNYDDINSAESNIRSALASRDPAALFRVGLFLTNPTYSADPLRGAAMALAACDLGYDCSSNNPENFFSICRESAQCPADADLGYYLKQSLGDQRFAQAYARAQQLIDSLAQSDASLLEPFIQINGTIAANVSKGNNNPVN